MPCCVTNASIRDHGMSPVRVMLLDMYVINSLLRGSADWHENLAVHRLVSR